MQYMRSTSNNIIEDGISNINRTEEGILFIKSFDRIIGELKENWSEEGFWEILREYSTHLETKIEGVNWPKRTKDEIMMYFKLFSDELAYTKNANADFPEKSVEILHIIISSLVPTMSVIMDKSDSVEYKREQIINMVCRGKSGSHKKKNKKSGNLPNLSEVCNDLLQYFEIVEQRNIGAPQFCIKNVVWNPEEDNINFSGYAWAAVPVGVYRKNRILEELEVQKFTQKYK